MSSLEELAKLPGYSDDGLTAVVPIRAVNFTSEPTAIWQRQLQDVSLREGGGSACVTGQPPAMDLRAGSRRNRCRSIEYQLYRAARPRTPVDLHAGADRGAEG